MILNLSSYDFKDGYFVLKKKSKNVFWVVVLCFCCVALFPTILGDSFQEFTPVQKIEEKKVSLVATKIQEINKNLDSQTAMKIVETTKKYAKQFGLDPALLFGLMTIESRFDLHAISPVGAFGLMQVLPRWHNDKIIQAKHKLGNPEVFDIETNIFLGSWILRDCKKQFSDINNALKCYNGSVGMATEYHSKVLSKKRIFDNMI